MLDQKQAILEQEHNDHTAFQVSGVDAWMVADGTIMLSSDAKTIALPHANTEVLTCSAFADGYEAGYSANEALEDESCASLTDYEFTQRIKHTLPPTLASTARPFWRQGYIFGRVLFWYEVVTA